MLKAFEFRGSPSVPVLCTCLCTSTGIIQALCTAMTTAQRLAGSCDGAPVRCEDRYNAPFPAGLLKKVHETVSSTVQPAIQGRCYRSGQGAAALSGLYLHSSRFLHVRKVCICCPLASHYPCATQNPTPTCDPVIMANGQSGPGQQRQSQSRPTFPQNRGRFTNCL